MANQYYPVRTDSAANATGDLREALLDYYGVYHADTNPLGVDVVYNTSSYLVFTCAALSDKFLRLYWSGAALWSYGDALTGNTVTNLVAFGGTAAYGTPTSAILVLGPRTLLWVNVQSTMQCRMVVIGQLTNGDYACFGCIGSATTSYNVGCAGRNTTDSTDILPVSMGGVFQSADGKLYTQPVVLSNGEAGIELNGDGSIATFQDLQAASYQVGVSAWVLGGGFVLTPCFCHFANGVPVLRSSLLMEFEAEE